MRNEPAMQSNGIHFVKNANLSHFCLGVREINLMKIGQAGAKMHS